MDLQQKLIIASGVNINRIWKLEVVVYMSKFTVTNYKDIPLVEMQTKSNLIKIKL